MPKGEGLTKSYALSADLAAIVGMTHASRGIVIKQLWAYIKEHKLQDPENKQYFTPDKKMAKVFGEDKIRGFGMAKFLSKHLYWKHLNKNMFTWLGRCVFSGKLWTTISE